MNSSPTSLRQQNRALEDCPRNRGFTLIELLVVVAVLAILFSILVPTVTRGMENAERILCSNNIRSFTLAAIAYTTENNGTMVSPYPGNNKDRNWVGGGNTDASLENGALWKYTGSHALYRCPTVPAELPNIRAQNRHYSPNNYLGGSGWYPNIAPTIAAVPEPSRTMYFLEEPDPRGANLGSWVMRLFEDKWVDPIGYWHNDGSNFTFVDGHVEYWKWQDPRTKIPGQTGKFFVSQAGNPDLERVQNAQMPGDAVGPNP